MRRGLRRGGRRDPLLLPLLVGLGVGELSVGAARVGGRARAAVRALDAGAAGAARRGARCARRTPPSVARASR